MVGMIKKEDVEKVRAAADLYDIVSATVTLKPSGTGTFVGLCPFHDEKTGSFNVRPSLGVWHCFGCGFPKNEQIPGHGHAPSHGHGHGHGDDSNAGGGIIIAD